MLILRCQERLWPVTMLGGTDANIYASTREILPMEGVSRDRALELPDFATLLTKDELDNKFEERRKKREVLNSQESRTQRGRGGRLGATPSAREIKSIDRGKRMSDD